MMKITEIREKTSAELATLLKEKKAELFNLRFQHAINQLDNPQKIVETKKSIAQILTVMTEKEQAEG
jgi:large subunit ribosomal protein L29